MYTCIYIYACIYTCTCTTAPAPHRARRDGRAALRIVLVTVPRLDRLGTCRQGRLSTEGRGVLRLGHFWRDRWTALSGPEIGNLLPNNRRQRRTCYALCHILYPVSAAHTSIFRMDSNSTSYPKQTLITGLLSVSANVGNTKKNVQKDAQQSCMKGESNQNLSGNEVC